MSDYKKAFIELAIGCNVLRFGEFKTKAGRLSPYFFNAGLFNNGNALRQLGQFYAKAIIAAQLPFDMLFGPAYKGIPLVSTIAIALAELGYNYPFCFNRKELKDHGEGGITIGAPLSGRVLIADDVISAGTSIGESVNIIRAESATPCGVIIALDRLEQGSNKLSAVQEVNNLHHIPVISIIDLNDIVDYLEEATTMRQNLQAIQVYRERYGAQ